jgi:hypothetical protein
MPKEYIILFYLAPSDIAAKFAAIAQCWQIDPCVGIHEKLNTFT